MQMSPATFDAELQPYVDSDREAGAGSVPDDASAALRGHEAFVSPVRRVATSSRASTELDDDPRSEVQSPCTAPNLTHLASRTTFAGGILNTLQRCGRLAQPRRPRTPGSENPTRSRTNAADDLARRRRCLSGMPDRGLSPNDTISDLDRISSRRSAHARPTSASRPRRWSEHGDHRRTPRPRQRAKPPPPSSPLGASSPGHRPRVATAGETGSARSTTRRSASCTAWSRCSSSSSAASKRC